MPSFFKIPPLSCCSKATPDQLCCIIRTIPCISARACQRQNGWVCCDDDGYEQSLPTAGSNTTKQDCVVCLELATTCHMFRPICGRIASLTLCTTPGLEAPAPAPFTCTRFVVKPRGRTGSYPMAGLAKHRRQRLARHRRQLLAKHSAPFWRQLTRGIRLCSQ